MVFGNTRAYHLQKSRRDAFGVASVEAAIENCARRRVAPIENEITKIPIECEKHQIANIRPAEDRLVGGAGRRLHHPFDFDIGRPQPLHDESMQILVGEESQIQAAARRCASAPSSATMSCAKATAARTSCSVM